MKDDIFISCWKIYSKSGYDKHHFELFDTLEEAGKHSNGKQILKTTTSYGYGKLWNYEYK